MKQRALSAQDFCAIMLAGGLGKRIRHLYPDTPKPMIPVAGLPFVEWVLRYLAAEGLAKFVISLGYLSQIALDYFATRRVDGLQLQFVREPEPLGTGGATKFAASAAQSEFLLVTNADTLALVDLSGVFDLFTRSEADVVIVGVPVEDCSSFGSLDVDAKRMLCGFREKQSGRGLVNAGIYMFKRHVVHQFPAQVPLSLEREVFPLLLRNGRRILVYESDAPFLDIGTPQSIARAEAFVREYLGGRTALK